MSSKSMRGRRILSTHLAAAVLIVAVMLMLASAMSLQVRSLEVSESYIVPLEEGIEEVRLDVVASRGEVDVGFADLDGDAVIVTASLHGTASMFGSDIPLNTTVTYDIDAMSGVVNVSAIMDVDAPWPYHMLEKVRFEIDIDRSLAAHIDITVVTGGAIVRTVEGSNITGLNIYATSLGSVVALNNGTILSGDVHIRTATGGTKLYWNNLTVSGDRLVTMEESSGVLRAMIDQTGSMEGTVTLLGKSIGGPVSLDMELRGDVGGSVEATSRGDIKMDCQDGFRCHDGTRASSGHPAASSFHVRLESTVGGIEARGRWTP
ncbi:MAG TPA: hypothetical protein PLI21_01235 [Methanomassiliicoccaceae archaeon]|nr:hypothetical protein [Methanomassiliicoccaceae archaeon]